MLFAINSFVFAETEPGGFIKVILMAAWGLIFLVAFIYSKLRKEEPRPSNSNSDEDEEPPPHGLHALFDALDKQSRAYETRATPAVKIPVHVPVKNTPQSASTVFPPARKARKAHVLAKTEQSDAFRIKKEKPIAVLFNDREALRRAVIAQEILSPPIAFRE